MKKVIPQNVKQFVHLHLPQSFPATDLICRDGRLTRNTEQPCWSASIESMPPYRGRNYYKVRMYDQCNQYVCTYHLGDTGKLRDCQLPNFTGSGDPQSHVYGTMLTEVDE